MVKSVEGENLESGVWKCEHPNWFENGFKFRIHTLSFYTYTCEGCGKSIVRSTVYFEKYLK